jgi:hypothetical protein
MSWRLDVSSIALCSGFSFFLLFLRFSAEVLTYPTSLRPAQRQPLRFKMLTASTPILFSTFISISEDSPGPPPVIHPHLTRDFPMDPAPTAMRQAATLPSLAVQSPEDLQSPS